MVQALTKSISLDEFLSLPETKPASEYIDGQISQKPMPQGKHSVIQTELVAVINRVVKVNRQARAFTELRATFGGRSIVPDASVFIWDRIPRDQNGEIANVFPLAPDWTIEILSPGQSQTKVTKNILHCLNWGTQIGWLIDPDEQTVLVFLPQQLPQIFDRPEQSLPAPAFAAGLGLSVGDLFGWLSE
ncbi:MAG: Uma2 family endonuclease [Synechocystis sp.]|jgi:Uma2 family endonuclease